MFWDNSSKVRPGAVGKTLLKRVEELSRQKSGNARGSARFFVIAHKAEIKKILGEGYDVKTLWQALKEDGRVVCSYPRFCDALRKYLLDQPPSQPIIRKQKIKSVRITREPSAPSRTSTEGFTFNSTPRKEDLY